MGPSAESEHGRSAKPSGGCSTCSRSSRRSRGYALGRERRKEKQTEVTLRAVRTTEIPRLRVQPEFPEAVWCPTTDYGTWVMRLDGLISITGNTTRAKNRAIADLLGTGEVSAEEISAGGARESDHDGPPFGPVVSAETKRRSTAAAVRLCGGDVERARRLWAKIQAAPRRLHAAGGRDRAVARCWRGGR
jgi:hypothetical protein